MPPFVDSLGDQFTAVLINSIGTIVAGIFTALFGAIVTTIITPVLQSFATSLGLGT
jgi:hypothetical protein